MRKIVNLFVGLFLLFNISQSYASQWSSHFSYTDCFQLTETSDYWVGATSTGLIMVAKEDNSISTYTKVNGLSDFGITSVRGVGNYLFVGYNNGNIDVIENNKVHNINDLKLVQGIVSKKINSFHLKDYILYCATDFGILKIDLLKKEIKDTYYIGENASYLIVNKLTDDDEYLYAATENGLFRSLIDAPDIHIYTAWEQISSDNDNYINVDVFESGIFAVKESVVSGKIEKGVEKYYDGSPVSLSLPSNNFISADVFDDLLYLVFKNSIEIYDANINEIKTIDNSKLSEQNISSDFVAVRKSNNKYIIADNSNGLLIYDNNWSKFLPMGPISNAVWNITFVDDKLWVLPGGITTAWNNENIAASASVLTSKGWEHLLRVSHFGGGASRDFVGIAHNNKFPEYLFINSYGSGVFQMDVDGHDISMKNHFLTTEGGLENIFDNDSHFVRVATSCIDDNGVLWMTNSSVDKMLVAYDIKQNKWYSFSYGAVSGLARTNNILALSNGDIWFVSNLSPSQGLFALRTNNDLVNTDNHIYKSFMNPSLDDDKRNKGQILIVDSDGEEVTKIVNSLVEDKNGHLWLGTDRGILINYQPQQVFNQETPIFSRIKVPRNDGTDYADYLFENDVINIIAVDAANRKWVGTQEIGAILVSSDGQKIIEEFNVNNSPLPSNFVKTITIDNKTGEVYFGTDNGIVSYRGVAIEGQDTLENVIAYPNPVRPGYEGDVTIKGLMDNSSVKITDVAGNLVYETVANSGQVFWNRKNLYGNDVKTGIYLIFVASEDGESSCVTKIAIIK